MHTLTAGTRPRNRNLLFCLPLGAALACAATLPGMLAWPSCSGVGVLLRLILV
ncbi:hypothetical protein ACAW63_04595 [Pseudomonas sp. QE6]|uniref:hypothetical protein n=1 Tax=Pseudomonas sp. QE6 TaxID=3242491 RepID=UPI003528A44F